MHIADHGQARSGVPARGEPLLGHTHTHTHFPSESKLRSARDMGNYYNQTSAFQAPLYKSLLGRKRKKHNMYTTAIYMRQKFTNEPTCDIHTVSSRAAFLHDRRFAHLPHEDLIPTSVVDGPRDEYQKDAATARSLKHEGRLVQPI